MASTKTVGDRFRERETWAAVLGNALGLLVATGVISLEDSQFFAQYGNEAIGLVYALATNLGLLISRGVAKIGTGN